MDAFQTFLFTTLVLMVPVWFVCIRRLARRLREAHAAKHEEMRLAEMWPQDLGGWLAGFDNREAVFALLRFLFLREDVRLRDPSVSRLSGFMRGLLWAYLGVFVMLLVSMFSQQPGNAGTASPEDQRRREAFALHRAQKWSEAIPLYDELLLRSDGDAEVHYWRGMAHWQLGHDTAALEDFRRTIALEPSNFEAHRNADRILSKQRRWNEVLDIWDPYIAANPANAEAYFERGGTNYHKGDRAAARSDAAKACQLGKSEACAWENRLR